MTGKWVWRTSHILFNFWKVIPNLEDKLIRKEIRANNYYVKLLFELLNYHNPTPFHIQSIWNPLVPLKVNFFTWKAAPLWLFWTVWHERNRVAFESKTFFEHMMMLRSFICYLWLWSNVQIRDRNISLLDFLTWTGCKWFCGLKGFSFPFGGLFCCCPVTRYTIGWLFLFFFSD